MTLESLLKITTALEVSPSQVLEKLGTQSERENYPLYCYELVASCPPEAQRHLHRILCEILELREA